MLWNQNNSFKVICKLIDFDKSCRNNPVVTSDILTLPGIINFIKERQQLEKLTIYSVNTFLIWNTDVIIIFSKVIEQLITAKNVPKMAKMQNFNCLNSVELYNRPQQYLFTHFDEVSDLSQITFVELSSLARMVLLENYPALNV